MTIWPKDTNEARIAFYGNPGDPNFAEKNLTYVYPPYAMFYPGDNGKRSPVTKIRVHKKCAAAFMAAFNEIWLAFGKSQDAINRSGLNEYNGGYEPRKVRGSETKWSNHAFGCAIDINASQNPLGATKGNMPQEAIDAFCRQGGMWGGWYAGRKDLMHFEFVDNGGRKPKNPPPTGTTAAKNVQPIPEDKQPDPVLKELQEVLAGMGYFEVGTVDGYMGGKTEGAIKAFLTDRHLESYTTIPTLLVYAKQTAASGWTRPIAPARAYATVADIAPKVASVQANKGNRLVGKIMAIPSAIGGAVWGAVSMIPDAYGAISPYASIVKEYTDTVPGWAWLALFAIAGFFIWRQTNKADDATLADYQTGKLNTGV